MYKYTCVEDVCPITPLCGTNPIRRPGPVVFAARDQGRPCAFRENGLPSVSAVGIFEPFHFFSPNENHPSQVGVKHHKESQGYKTASHFQSHIACGTRGFRSGPRVFWDALWAWAELYGSCGEMGCGETDGVTIWVIHLNKNMGSV